MKKGLIVILVILLLTVFSFSDTILNLNLTIRENPEWTNIKMLVPLSIIRLILNSDQEFEIDNKDVDKEMLKKGLEAISRGEVFEASFVSEDGEEMFLSIKAVKNISKISRKKFRRFVLRVTDSEDQIKISLPMFWVKLFSAFIKRSVKEEFSNNKALMKYLFSPYEYFEDFGGEKVSIIEINSSDNEHMEIALLK